MGLSKIVRVVSASRLGCKTQTRLTCEVADTLESTLGPRNVGVAFRATDLCMTVQGAASPRPSTVTTAMRGLLQDDPAIRDQFTRLTTASARTSN